MPIQSPPLPFRVRAQPLAFFETPIAYCQLDDGEDFLIELEQIVRKRREEDGGIKRSNIGGWHSDSKMLLWGGEAAAILAKAVTNVCKRMSHFKGVSQDAFDWQFQMWANITHKGGMNDMHTHPGNLWAAVLYLDMGDGGDHTADVGGNFFVEDPRFPMNVMRNTGFRLVGMDGSPQEVQQELKLKRGDLLVFPSWLRHGVRPYIGEHERVTIAMNLDAIFNQCA